MYVQHTPSTGIDESQLPLATAKHHYLEFTNNRQEFIALVDSGAQMNVISENILSSLSYSTTIGPCPYLRWGDSEKCRIVKWIILPVKLQNGHKVQIRSAVVRGLAKSIILGHPFLIDAGANEDHVVDVLTTSHGPVPLLVGYSHSTDQHNLNAEAVPHDKDDEDDEIEMDVSEKEMRSRTESDQMSESQRRRLRKLLRLRAKLWKGETIGVAKGVQHVLEPNTKRPIVLRPRRYTDEQSQEIVIEIKQMLKDGIIRPSSSPNALELVLVLKANGKWRVCVDFRALNKVTTPDKYPIPRAADLLKAVKGSKYFVALDQRWGYWQIPLEESSCKYTAFRCPLGLFEFVVMPFGLINAPATFQRFMDNTFGDLRYKGVLTYIDDILIHGDTVDEVLDLLEIVLERMEKAGLHLNLGKCDFFPHRLKYLGHFFEEGFMYPNPAKVDALKKIKKPTSICEVRSLIGMLNYYKDFIPRFSHFAAPLNDLLKGCKGTKKEKTVVIWGEVHDLALEVIRQSLIDAVLTVPIDSDEFLLETDASNHGFAAVVSVKRDEKWAPVQFSSKKFEDAQLRWPVRENKRSRLFMDCKSSIISFGVVASQCIRIIKACNGSWKPRLASWHAGHVC